MAAVASEAPATARDRVFERLYRAHVKDVYQYALALTRNPADAEDITQTTFLNAYRAIKRGDEIQKPHNWLIKIAHNAARTRYARASCRVKEVPFDDHVERLAVPEPELPNVEAVLYALGRLPLNQRTAIVLRELEGRTYAEIAEMIGVSVPAVETLIFRARRSLRLKAGAIRVLNVVPLPASLAKLLPAGGVVSGGSALMGSSLLLKIGVAVVAGVVVAGGLGGEQTRGVRGVTATTSRSAVVGGSRVGHRGNAVRPGRPATGAPAVARGGATGQQGAANPEPLAQPTTPPTAVTAAVTSAITTVPAVTAVAVPQPLVSPPSPPSLPVQLPAPPAVTVTVPTLP